MSSIAALVFALIMPGLASLVPGPPPPDAPVDAAQRRAVVQALAQALRGHYVFPEVAERAARDLDRKLAAGGYGQSQAHGFAEALTSSLRAITRDRHLRIRFDPGFRGSDDPNAEPSAEEKARFGRLMARLNFGVSKVEVLPGNSTPSRRRTGRGPG